MATLRIARDVQGAAGPSPTSPFTSMYRVRTPLTVISSFPSPWPACGCGVPSSASGPRHKNKLTFSSDPTEKGVFFFVARASAREVRASAASSSESVNDDGELENQRQQLARMMGDENSSISGQELRELVFNKFNRSYDVRLQRRGNRMYLHVMWKHLEQKSFHLTEEEYDMQLQAVAEYLTMWGVVQRVREGINAAKHAPGYITGGNAKAYSIPLGVEVGTGARSNEWNTF